MKHRSLSYLSVVMDELKRAIIPALPSAEQSGAEHLLRILGCIYLEEVEEPTLTESMRSAWLTLINDLLPELTAQSSNRRALMDSLEGLKSGAAIDRETLRQTLSSVCAELGSRDTERGWRALGKLTDLDIRAEQEAENAYRRIITRTPAADEAKLPIETKLAPYLRACYPEEKDIAVDGVRYLKAGFTNYTVVVDLKNTVNLPARIVVRADRKGFHPTGVSVEYEYPILTKAFEHGVCVPKLYALEKSGEVLGTPFIVVDFVDGGNIGDFMDVGVHSATLGRDLAQKLAQLHKIPLEEFGNVKGSDKNTREEVTAFVDMLDSVWHGKEITECGLSVPSVETAFQWLRAHMDDCEGHRCLIHKDLGFHNMLVEGDRVSAILDWSDAQAANPAEDLAYVKTSVDQLTEWDDFLKAYADSGAFVPPPEQIDFYYILSQQRAVVLFSLIEARCKLGLTKDIPFVQLASHYLRRTKLRLFNKLAEVIRHSTNDA